MDLFADVINQEVIDSLSIKELELLAEMLKEVK